MSLVEIAPLAQVGYAQEAIQQLREAIQHLPPEEKEVFLLREQGQLTYEQVAQRHHRSVTVVKEQMRGALRKLRTVAQEVSSGYAVRCFRHAGPTQRPGRGRPGTATRARAGTSLKRWGT